MEQTTTAPTQNKLPNPNRTALKVLSEQVAPLVEQGEYETINAALIGELYEDENHQEFRTFHQWLKDGYQVQKGSKAFLVWAKPKEKQKDDSEAEETEEKPSDKFFPLCYLFSNAQVAKK